MKRMILLAFCLLIFTGCSALAPDSYLSIAPHQSTDAQTISTDAATATDYKSLKSAILAQVRAGQSEGIIHVTGYNGVVEDDLNTAAYEVSTLDPLGAYAIEYMTHSCSRILSLYELRISITFRRTPMEISQIQYTSTRDRLQDRLNTAIENNETRFAVRINNYRHQEQEIPTMVKDYCLSNPATVMEIPWVSVAIYPETGTTRILEVTLQYENSPQQLAEKQKAVQEGIDAAAEYIRYREGDYDKIQLLYSYLAERFNYEQKETATPLYDALCSGVADPLGLSQAWQLICQQAGMKCHTVFGLRGSEDYNWNIVFNGENYRHLDLAKCLLDRRGLVLRTDAEMNEYYWDSAVFPACPIPAAPPPVETPTPEETPPEEVLPEEPSSDPNIPEYIEILPQP